MLKEYEREQLIMQKLVESVGQAMIGASTLSLVTLNAAINAEKEKIVRLEKQIPEALKSVNDEKQTLESLDTYYENFISWADEFDKASRERKKMIICNLIKKIMIGKDYHLDIILNMDYRQFLE